MRRAETTVAARLDALREAVELVSTRFETPAVDTARTVVSQAQARLGLSVSHTVVAVAGGTGSGKSSLFNALAGRELSAVGVRRPTTSTASACVWPSEEDATPLLDWLSVPRRHHLDTSDAYGALSGLVLLDLPDFDSTAETHRLEVERLVNVVDAFVWVLDPQKYADAAVHEGYLKALAGYGEVTIVVLNHSDRLADAALGSCLGDLRQLLREDGLERVEPLAVSARTGAGVDELRRVLAERVRSRRAAVARLGADIDDVVGQLSHLCAEGDDRAPSRAAGDGENNLVEALADAAGVGAVAQAAAGSYRLRAHGHVGWPLTRWLRRLRPDPLRRLHLGSAASGRTSLPSPDGAALARVSNALRELADVRSAGMPAEWRAVMRSSLGAADAALAAELDVAAAAADVDARGTRGWWRIFGTLQVIALLAAVAGGVWLTVMVGVAYLQLPDPPLPRVGEMPLPTLLLLGGLVAGLLLVLLARPFVAAGAGRAGHRARRSVIDHVSETAERLALSPADTEARAYSSFCDALRRASR